MRISDWSSDVCSSDLLTTAMAAAQQAAQHAVTAARTSYEKVTGSPFQDIGRLDDYAADVVRALGDVDLLKSHFTGRALGEIDFEQVKAAIKTAEGGEKRRELRSEEHTSEIQSLLRDSYTAL